MSQVTCYNSIFFQDRYGSGTVYVINSGISLKQYLRLKMRMIND